MTLAVRHSSEPSIACPDRRCAYGEVRASVAEAIEAAGLSVRDASPFSSAWSSLLDPSRAVAELGFEHPPLDTYLDATIASLQATWPPSPPPGYAQRDRELALAARCWRASRSRRALDRLDPFARSAGRC